MNRYVSAFVLLALTLVGFPAAASAADPETVRFAATEAYQGKAVTLTGELYRPEGDGPFPAVVLMHGCGGMTNVVRHGMKVHAENLNRHGFVALALDSFGPRGNGNGWVCDAGDRLARARIYREADAIDARDYLRTLDYVDGEHIFQMGQSNGAGVSIRLSQRAEPAFKAVTAYYPWCGTFTRYFKKAKLTTPILVLSGARDDWTPPAVCQSLETTGADYEVMIYPNAVHSFDLDIALQDYKGHKVGYDAQAAPDSRTRMIKFFRKYLSEDLLARLPEPAAEDPDADPFLTGDAISELMPTIALKGVNAYGNPFTVTYREDGFMSGVAGKQNEFKDTGKWWTKDDTFCRQYKSWLEGAAGCFQVRLKDDTISFFDADGNFVSSNTIERHDGETEPAQPAAPAPDPFLTGDAIRKLMPSIALTGVNSFGNPYTVRYRANGFMSGVAGKSNQFKDSGKWWVHKNAFCRQYRSWLNGTAACFKVQVKDNTISFFDAAGNFVSSNVFLR